MKGALPVEGQQLLGSGALKPLLTDADPPEVTLSDT